MATAFDEPTNDRLRRIARGVIERNKWTQARLAEELGVSASFVSDFLNEKRGAGLDLLVGLGRIDPLQLLEMLEIDPVLVANLIAGGQGEEERGTDVLPDVIRRAMRAAIEVTGCPVAQAFEAAQRAYADFGDVHLDDAEWWFARVRNKIPDRPKSGVRPSVKPKKQESSQA